MGWLESIKSALGIQRPLLVRDGEATLEVSAAARDALDALPDFHGVHLSTSPVDGGWVVRVEPGPSQGPTPPGLDDLPITASDADLHRLRGLVLDCRDDRWSVAIDLEVRARETPNPNGRMYLVDRLLATGRAAFFSGAGPHPPLGERLLAIPGVVTALARDNSLTIERVPGTSWDAVDSGVDATLRQYFLLCGHELAPEDLPERDDPLEREVWAVLEAKILPGIHRDGGDLSLVSVTDGVVRVAMTGACKTCPSSTATLRFGVERALKEAFPGRIERVEQV